MSTIKCTHLTFHGTLHGQKLEEGYREMGFLWTFDRKENVLECAICLHDDTPDVGTYLPGTPNFEAVKTTWKACQHQKRTLESGITVCRTCLIAML